MRPRHLLFALRLLEVDVLEALNLGGLRVGGADHAHACERLLENRRDAVVEIGEPGPGVAQAAIDLAERAAEQEAHHHHDRRERPGDVEERADVEERDARPLHEAHGRFDRDGGAVGLDQEDVGDLAGGPLIEQVEIGPLQAA